MIGFKQIEFFDHTGISKALLLRGAYGGTEPTARCSAGHLGSQSGQVIRFRFGWRGSRFHRAVEYTALFFLYFSLLRSS